MRLQESTWTDKRTAELQKCFHLGMSCSEIGHCIGVTRNSVIGKLHRLGLSRPQQIVQKKAKLPREYKSTIRFRKPRPILDRVHAAVAPDPKNKTFFELQDGECKWPLTNDSPYLFCAHDVLPDLPYCAHHAQRAYTHTQGKNENRAYAVAKNNRPSVMTLAASKDREDGAGA